MFFLVNKIKQNHTHTTKPENKPRPKQTNKTTELIVFCRVSLCIVADPPFGETLSSVTNWRKSRENQVRTHPGTWLI